MNRCLFVGAMTGLGLMLLAGAAAGQDPLRHVERGQPLEPCPRPSREGSVARESRGRGFTVDACGRKVSDSGNFLQFDPQRPPAGLRAAAHATIDRMTTGFSYASHFASDPLFLVGYAETYVLSDRSSWLSGAGSAYLHSAQLDHVEVSGTTLRFVLSPPDTGLLFEQTDYDNGDHSAQGQLGPSGALVLETEAGSRTAVLRGNALVVSNDPTWYGDPRFNYYSAVAGSVVPFETVYTMLDGTWTADAFSRSFSYSVLGSVDFAHPVSTPRAVGLSITGPSRVPDELTVRYAARVRYETGTERDVSSDASWTVDPAALANVTGGLLTIGTLTGPQAELTLRATFAQGADSFTAERAVLCLADDPAEKPGTWPMFQANARHTGYLGAALHPETFTLKWQRNLGIGLALNPVAAGDGKVFATLRSYFIGGQSLFALRASDGAVLWSKGFGSVFSVNPPSYAYGNVYVQTGNHASDTWLHAFDGATGDVLFKTPHAAQWERYFAPTMFDGKAYVNGGYYGGMYSFDAYNGEELWFADLPQYDEWTPAVDAGRAYAYVGEYDPGLYARNRAAGTPALFVSDPAFDWNGWSMGLAPVLGAHDDVIAIHDGRLISFDTALGTVRWTVQSRFAGQPSLAHDQIYAIDGGRLRVLDEVTHADLWTWQPPDGELAGPMIVTDQLVFASTGHSVHAVDLASRQSVWSYPVGGHLAIADDTLYVASQDGTLTAFFTPSATSFYTVSPCRVVDTRGTFGVPVGGPALAGGVSRVLQIAGHCGVPATAKAVSVNVTVTGAGAPGNVRLDATGDPSLLFSTLNYSVGQTRANSSILALNQSGELTATAAQAAGTTVHLIVDVNGYFE